MIISYEEFEEHINHIIKILDFQKGLDDLGFSAGVTIEFPELIDDVVSLLALLTNDKYGWIDYFVFELDCGRNYTEGMIWDEDDNTIKMQTTEDLWNYILSHQDKWMEKRNDN